MVSRNSAACDRVSTSRVRGDNRQVEPRKLNCMRILRRKGSAMFKNSFWKSSMLALALSAPVFAPIHALAGTSAKETAPRSDGEMLADVLVSLRANRFKNVHVEVIKGVVNLNGTVELYDDKVQAQSKAQHVKGVAAVRDRIQVAGPQIPDDQLQRELLRKVQYDRVGYGTTAFNAISVQVREGVATLGGHAYGPTDKDSAISLAAHLPGIRDVVDNIEVDPVSPMDDQIRIQVARSVYGFASLNRYAIDPAKPIRISVQNGHVTLFGVVDSQMDKDTAALRANGVPGVFSVSNQLDVASQGTLRE